MTKEQTIQAIKVMQGFVDGKEVQYKLPDSKWPPTDNPAWNWFSNEYRIKPTTVLHPWTADEVPLGAWMRHKQDLSHRWVVTDTGDELWRQAWFEDSEHSTDNGKTWLPCGVMEDGK